MSPTMVAELPRSRNRPARSRREQALRAEARTVSRFLRGVAQLQSHRGSQPSRLGAALARALREASAPSGQAEDAETVHADLAAAQAEEPASSASAVLRSLEAPMAAEAMHAAVSSAPAGTEPAAAAGRLTEAAAWGSNMVRQQSGRCGFATFSLRRSLSLLH